MTASAQEETVRREKKQTLSMRMPKGYDRWIYFSMLFLIGFGILMIASASMGLEVGDSGYLLKTVVKQIIFGIAGYIAVLVLAGRFRLEWLRSMNFLFVIGITGFALVFTLAFSSAGGAQAWIRLPIPGIEVSIQPSEFAKIMAILIVAAYLGDVKVQFKTTWLLVRRPVYILLAYVFIILVLESDFGSAAVLAAISYICFLIPSNKQLWHMQRGMVIGLAVILGLAVFMLTPYGEAIIGMLPLQEYQINRIYSSINPFSDQYGSGYQLINGLVSFASGGWFGVGFGNSVRKYTNFPAANTDFILAIIVEELGFIGFLMILVPYCIIIFRLMNYALKIRNEKAKIILIGVAMYFLLHFILNVGGVTGLIPLTGVPLLMISAGGSSTLAAMSALGIAQAIISRYKRGLIE